MIESPRRLTPRIAGALAACVLLAFAGPAQRPHPRMLAACSARRSGTVCASSSCATSGAVARPRSIISWLGRSAGWLSRNRARARAHDVPRQPGLTADQLADIGSEMRKLQCQHAREPVSISLHRSCCYLDVALHIEAARMQDVLDRQADWDVERGHRTGMAQLLKSDLCPLCKIARGFVRGNALRARRARTRTSFDKTTGAMLKNFHDAWYAPNNAILIVVGDVDPAATLSESNLSSARSSRRAAAKPKICAACCAFAQSQRRHRRARRHAAGGTAHPGLDSRTFPRSKCSPTC